MGRNDLVTNRWVAHLTYPTLILALLSPATVAAADDFVSDQPVANLVSNPAHYFDLNGKTIRFTPRADGSYLVQTAIGSPTVACIRRLEDPAAQGPWYSKGWSVPLPFNFPFAGKVWNRVFVNMDGNLSFDKAESDSWEDRNPWPDGGMCSVAAAIDSRSVAGMEQMIAPLWGPYQNPTFSQVFINATPQGLAVTWNMTRAAWGQAVLGVNSFQARIYPSGMIEFAYPHVAERDGIVGVFTGTQVDEKPLSQWTRSGKTKRAAVDMTGADVYDDGSVLDLAITMKNDAITHVNSGSLAYRCWIKHDGETDMVAVTATDQPRMSCWLGASPRTGGWRISGNRVDMYVSKVLLAGCKQCSMAWDVTWFGKRGRSTGSGGDLPAISLSAMSSGTAHFSTAHEAHAGNIFEVFHYPVVTKYSERILASIYQHAPPHDDIAIVFTDFRIDDLFGQGGGAIAANIPIEGIGQGNARPRSTAGIGTRQLQMSIATVWLGSPLFDPSGTESDGTRWFNFAHGVRWLAHECTHRWGLDMSFVNPQTGQAEKLTDSVGHWRIGLDTSAMYPVSGMFLQQPGPGYSIMGGYSWRQNGDRTFSQADFPFDVPGGYSPLDLYVMGMLPPEKVPPMFLLENLNQVGWNEYQGTPMMVTMPEIIQAMGERVPSFADSQKIFHMKFYIVHEPGRAADPALMDRAGRISVALANYFWHATGEVMKVVPSGP
ncbi:MAG TPA: hypothetical protein VMD30_05700 [Tepidisphaeraceae bacterium]|nr:hypothetical protein [Tepidisphaeraceae bacterium]